MTKKKLWEDWEDKILKDNKSLSIKELCDLLPHRTKGQIRGRKDRLRLNRKRGKSWEDWEDEIIKKHWKKGDEYLKTVLPHRTIGSVNSRRKGLGLIFRIKPTLWSKDEIQFFIDNHKKGDRYLENNLNRTLSSIIGKRYELELFKDEPELISEIFWKEEELNILNENSNLSDKEIQKLLPNRTVLSIKTKRNKLKLFKDNPYHIDEVWFNNKSRIIDDYNSGNYSIKELSLKWNINIRNLTNHLVSEGLYKTINYSDYDFVYNQDWIKNKEKIIDEYEKGVSIKTLHKKYQLSQKLLRNNLEYERVYIPHSSSSIYIEKNYFEKIDNSSKSYFLGLMYSDGYVSGKDSKISLTITDKDVVYDFKNSLKSEHSVQKIKPKKYNGKFYKTQYELSVHNNKLKSDLIDKGCIPHKSMILKFPSNSQVPKKYILSFMYGYFDGDGHLGIHKRNKGKSRRIMFEVVGTKDMMNNYKRVLLEYLGFDCDSKITVKQRKHELSTEPLTHLIIGDTLTILKVFELLYNSYPSKMERKRNNFINFMKWVKINPKYKRNGKWYDRFGESQKPIMEIVKKYV